MQYQPEPYDVTQAIETAIAHEHAEKFCLEIAFFGGSFTALERGYMISLLEAAQPFVTGGIIKGIRVSTRPDAVDDAILQCLKQYGVTAIELGAQSMVDAVLRANRRGHTAQQVRNAAKLIKAQGFALGLQMMTGLYTDTAEGAVQTAAEIAECKPDTVRIYPTVILRHTRLGELYEQGRYCTLSLEETVELCSGLLVFFEQRYIPVIRLGLHDSPELQRNYLAGPWHPAFGELCYSRKMRNEILRRLHNEFVPGEIILTVHPAWHSKAVGQKRCNLQFFADLGYDVQVRTDENMAQGQWKLQRALSGKEQKRAATVIRDSRV